MEVLGTLIHVQNFVEMELTMASTNVMTVTTSMEMAVQLFASSKCQDHQNGYA
jgi:hypothetical protein